MPPFHPDISIANAATRERARGPSRSTYAREPAVVPFAGRPRLLAVERGEDDRAGPPLVPARGRAPARSGSRPRPRRRRPRAPRARCRGARPRATNSSPGARRVATTFVPRTPVALEGHELDLVEPGVAELRRPRTGRPPGSAASPTGAARARRGPTRAGGRPRRRSRRRGGGGGGGPSGGGIIAPSLLAGGSAPC